MATMAAMDDSIMSERSPSQQDTMDVENRPPPRLMITKMVSALERVIVLQMFS